jgi:cobalt/nickel transport system permease protein
VTTGHAERLYHPGSTVVHRLPAQCKLVALLTFVLVVVATPRDAYPAFAGYAIVLGVVAVAAHTPPAVIVRRMVVELPFVFFALLLPFVARGERTEVLGLSLSIEGLVGAGNILAKATLGVVASILLAATTEPRELLLGFERLRMPPIIVQITTFMLRYVDVVLAELRRMRIARESRGFRARDIRDIGVLARSAGALFIRSYERGERVYLAMLSRGYTGSMPALDSAAASRRDWLTAALLPLSALSVAAAVAMS